MKTHDVACVARYTRCGTVQQDTPMPAHVATLLGSAGSGSLLRCPGIGTDRLKSLAGGAVTLSEII